MDPTAKASRFALQAKAVCVVPLTMSLVFLIAINGSGCSGMSRDEIVASTTILSILVYVLILTALFLRSGKIDFVFLFVLVSWPFYFGQQLLSVIGAESSRTMINIGQLTDDAIFHAGVITLICVNALCLAYNLYPANYRQRPVQMHSAERETLKKACLAVAIIVLIPTLLTLYRNYSLSASVGYGTRISDESLQLSGIDNIAGIAAQFMPYALLGLFLSRKKGDKWQAVALLTYIALYIATGSRTQGFILLIAVAVVWTSVFSKKTPLQQLAAILVVGLAVAFLFSAVSLARSVADTGNAVISDMLFQNNPIVDAIQEAGQTFVVLGTVYTNTPQPIPFGEGATYLSGIVYVLPNGLTGNYYDSVDSVDQLFASFLTNYGGVGSSFVAEAYYNFGQASILIMVVFGLLLGKLQKEYENSLSKGNYFATFACACCFMICSFYIRSDVRTFIRNFVWSVGPILLLGWAIRNRSKPQEQYNSNRKSIRLARNNRV